MNNKREQDYITNKILNSMSRYQGDQKQTNFLKSRLSMCVKVFDRKTKTEAFYGARDGDIYKGPIQQLCNTLEQINIVELTFEED